jgi:hypothetical protein
MTETTPANPMDEDLQYLEENLHRLVSVARMLARDADAIEGRPWNEPYAYRAATAALKASMNLRRQLEARWLVSPLPHERPDELPPETSRQPATYPPVSRGG